MKIYCPACRQEALPREKGHFCPPCGRVFGAEKSKPRAQPKMPTSFKVKQSSGQLLVSWRWMRKSELKYFPLVLLFIFATAFGTYFLWHENTSLIVKVLFTTVLILPSLGGAYDRACVLLNRASLYTDSGVVTLSHGPLPGRASREFDAAEVAQLFSVERPTLEGQVYDLRLITKNNERQTLVKNLESVEQVLFLEQALESFLKIDDQAVEGEIKR